MLLALLGKLPQKELHAVYSRDLRPPHMSILWKEKQWPDKLNRAARSLEVLTSQQCDAVLLQTRTAFSRTVVSYLWRLRLLNGSLVSLLFSSFAKSASSLAEDSKGFLIGTAGDRTSHHGWPAGSLGNPRGRSPITRTQANILAQFAAV